MVKKNFKITVDDLDEITDNAYENFKSGIKSEITLKKYTSILTKQLNRLDDFLSGSTEDRCDQFVRLAKKDPKKVLQIMLSMARKLRERTELEPNCDDYLKPSSIPNQFKPIKKLFEMNDVLFSWNKVHAVYPDIARVSFSKTRGYTKPEISAMLDYAKGSMERAIPLVLSSSGMRVGALVDLTWDDLTPVYKVGQTYKAFGDMLESELKESKLACAVLIIYKGSSSEGFSFITPEAYNALQVWLSEYKDEIGHTPKPQDPIFKKSGIFAVKTSVAMLSKRIDRMVLRAGIQTKLPKGVRRKSIPKTNGFRYYFDKTIKDTVSDGSTLGQLIRKEFMMNHTGLVKTDRNYFKSHLIELVQEYVKSLPGLTVTSLASKDSEILRLQEAIKQDSQREVQDNILMEKLEEVKKDLEDFKKAKPAMERRFNQFANFLETYDMEEYWKNYQNKKRKTKRDV